MLHLRSNEKILVVVHRHWFILLGKIIVGIVLLILPFVVIPLISAADIMSLSFGPTLFFFIIYLMIITLFLFSIWIDYYLDAWIITTLRIVDIEQRGLFNREVSEFMLSQVQDVTINIPNMVATLLKFGDITIQTAGERSFTIKQVPDVYTIKNIILDYSKNGTPITEHGRTQ